MWLVNQAGAKAGTASTGWLHIDSLLNGYTKGSGTAGTLPIWATSSTLGNSSLSEASGVISSSLTGALKLPAGTDAQDPVWAAGMLRYNTTTNGLQGYDGTAERYLPWADAANWNVGYVPFSDGAKLTSTLNFTYKSSGGIYVNSTGGNLADFSRNGTSYITFQSDGDLKFRDVNGVGIEWFASPTGAALKKASSGLELFLWNGGSHSLNVVMDGTAYASLGANRLGGKTSARGVFSRDLFAGGSASLGLTVRGGENETGAGGDIIVRGGNSSGTNTVDIGGNVYIRSGNQGTAAGSTNANGLPGYVYIQTYSDSNVVSVPGTIRTLMSFFQENISMFHLNSTTTGTRILTMEGDTVKYRIENLGTISTSTDSSGDIVVAHGMGTTPTSVQVTVTGTTPYVVTVHTIGGTNFTVRFYDMTGAAVASTAVTATWHCKT
jgi:hypothetical protein